MTFGQIERGGSPTAEDNSMHENAKLAPHHSTNCGLKLSCLVILRQCVGGAVAEGMGGAMLGWAEVVGLYGPKLLCLVD